MKQHNRMLAAVLCLMLILSLFGCSLTHEHEYDNDCDADCNTCGEIREVAHQFENETIDEDGHVCVCSICGEKIEGEHQFAGGDVCSICSYKAAPREFPSGYITTEPTHIETKYIQFDIEEGIYVVDNLERYADTLYEALETVTGLSFTEGTNSSEKPLVNVIRPVIPEGNEFISKETEMDDAFAEPEGVTIPAGDLFIGSGYAIAHELAHVLSYRYTQKTMYITCKTLHEGFAEYTSYITLKYLEENDPEVAAALSPSFTSKNNMEILEPSVVYTQKAEYWLTNLLPIEISLNQGYDIGFRMMRYFETTYGNYSEWLKTAEEYPASTIKEAGAQIAVLKQTYGSDVLDGFYPWLMENEKFFRFNDRETIDYSGTDFITLYPHYNAVCNRTEIFNQMVFDPNCPTRLRYNNLHICIDEIRNYLETYKDTSADGLILEVKETCVVKLYDAGGRLLETVTGQTEIPLDGVSYIKLDGEGITNIFSISGYKEYNKVLEEMEEEAA